MHITLWYDLRSSPIGAPHEELYAAALDHCSWIDGLDVDSVGVVVSEHHGAEDGYLPSPIVFAAAVAARTRRASISIGAAIIPFYHPIRLAEDLAVLDLISGGRASVVLGAGYRREEFAMYGVDLADRPRIVEETVDTLTKAWSGEPFEFRGERVRVTPRPMQRPRPPIILGGSSKAAARRAARMADGFLGGSPELMDVYREERIRLGHDPGPPGVEGAYSGNVVLIREDPESGWAAVGDYCLHTTNSYAQWIAEGAGAIGPYQHAPDVDTLRATGHFLVLTPEECIEIARRDGSLMMTPLVSGFPPELALASLQLFENEVLPALSGD